MQKETNKYSCTVVSETFFLWIHDIEFIKNELLPLIEKKIQKKKEKEIIYKLKMVNRFPMNPEKIGGRNMDRFKNIN